MFVEPGVQESLSLSKLLLETETVLTIISPHSHQDGSVRPDSQANGRSVRQEQARVGSIRRRDGALAVQ